MTKEETALRAELQEHVRVLTQHIGERNYVFIKNLDSAAAYLEKKLIQSGFSVHRQAYSIKEKTYYNIEAEKKGSIYPERIILIGAHYDSYICSPGADDNGSGSAALLALARAFSGSACAYTLRFVAFANEEPPWFWTKNMGSYVYAAGCRARAENIVAMLSLESLGYYSDVQGSQHYLFPLQFFYPSQGNFIAFISNLSSFPLLKKAVGSFRLQARFPSEGGAFPWFIPGIFWSDHWPFWRMGYQALMVTDTALFRNPYYHREDDTPDKLDFERMARVVAGLEKVIRELAQPG